MHLGRCDNNKLTFFIYVLANNFLLFFFLCAIIIEIESLKLRRERYVPPPRFDIEATKGVPFFLLNMCKNTWYIIGMAWSI